MALAFDRTFDPAYGTAVEIIPGVRRLTANNPGSYTFRGTNTYLIGTDPVVVVDPGPEDEAHVAAILDAAGGASISHILVTHTHRDHSAGATLLSERAGARLVGAGPHRFARSLHLGETTELDASADLTFTPDEVMSDGDIIAAPAGLVRAIATPGHAANHLCFGLEGSGLIFSGDHVMAWSTSIVAPPDGSMADYMASLDRLLGESETTYLPGHGAPVASAHHFVLGLKEHRVARETAVLHALEDGALTIPEIVADVYRDTDPKLWAAAGLSVFAQLEWLVEKRLVTTDGEPMLGGRYSRAA